MKTKALLLSGVVLSLAACGFEPMYGTTRFNEPTAAEAAVEAELASVEIANIPNFEGQYLRNLLIDRFYTNKRPENPKYRLSIATIKETTSDLDITKQSDATRAQLKLSTTMTLADKATGETLVVRELVALSSYNIVASEFATRISEENVRKNVLNDLAQQIELQTGLYFKR